MYKVLTGARIPIKVWVDDLENIEAQATAQLLRTANLPWVEAMAVMPDVHWGNGATVGSVIVNRGAVSPAVVGVDIGCGICAVRTVYRGPDLSRLRQLRHSIERSVPVGFDENKAPTDRTDYLLETLGQLSELGLPFEKKARHQLGTLGGGNHFIEVCVDTEDYVWVMLHSGSRGTGNQLARIHLERAKGFMADELKSQGTDPELSALTVGQPEYQAYMRDLNWCQNYAAVNRQEMLLRVLKDLAYHMHGETREPATMYDMFVSCHHNYIEEDHDVPGRLITRKGAVSAKAGQLGIIPGSMGAKSFIVRGRGNADSFCSCSHGAGRRMSRGAAKRTFQEEDVVKQTEGVECRKDKDVIDEIPGAYKDIDAVMEQQSDLVEIVATLKQVLCVKG